MHSQEPAAWARTAAAAAAAVLVDCMQQIRSMLLTEYMLGKSSSKKVPKR
jgi:hypothetical protein